MEYIIKTDDLINHESLIEDFLEMMFDSLYQEGKICNPVQFKVEALKPMEILENK